MHLYRSQTFNAIYRILAALIAGAWTTTATAQNDLRIIYEVDAQPLSLQVERLVEALDFLGTPLPQSSRERLEAARALEDDDDLVREIQQSLDPYCLFSVQINPESRVKVSAGPAPPSLLINGWRSFLVKVHNEAGVTARLRATSPNARPLHGAPSAEVRQRWLELSMFDERPLRAELSGIAVEYRVIQLYANDRGLRSAVFAFDVGQGTQDIGFRNDLTMTFKCDPTARVKLRVRDEHDKPAVAGFVIRDALGRVYPTPSKRLAPDFSFQPQVYRANGEEIMLPPGEFTIECTRGPEYLPQQRTIRVGTRPMTVEFALQRWVDPSLEGWWSGDHHIHAAGCAHYTDPTQGVHPHDMIRHIMGEDLKVGANLTWGPCFDYQKQFFSGNIDRVSDYPYLLRYDIEISGFGSHRTGHLCLLRLKDQIYPGGESMHHWPTLGLTAITWAKEQGAVVGYAHSALGLATSTHDIPSYEIPPFDGIGANEYIMTVTHRAKDDHGRDVRAVDFISTVDTMAAWELNIWYHTLNCGYETRISGETDFPCIYGERVGMGRSYVKQDRMVVYTNWCEGIRRGRSYVSDGRSHLMNFRVDYTEVGSKDNTIRLKEPGSVHVTALVSALLDETPDPSIKKPLDRPYWHLEKARVGDSRQVPLEVIVNGEPVKTIMIEADGTAQELEFDVEIEKSSWIALRILPSSHTNPMWITVGGKPIRASRKSAEWCIASLEQCWNMKQRFYDEDEMDAAIAAYDHARAAYKKILSECE